MSETLWCVHLPELNDFIATVSEEAAVREAVAINAYREKFDNLPKGSTFAVAREWPFSEPAHVRSLEVDSGDLQRMPHRKVSSCKKRRSMSSVMRWIIGGLSR
ncbi:hypothetical protein [Paraburkholderia bryophila]|uniref:Uncharacterized protein n=1 Tax=Paraburkholderia bryophila TaxID=420952 RepID=A0A7Z0BAB5_9BURK|nr:hypothetical protein [Paraburkholderia bryophila]NYH27184.1 hypothetical protein [Paraburkholderia bryophila]